MYRYQIEKIRKYYGDDDDLGPKDAVYVWDNESGINILTFVKDYGGGFSINNANSYRFWNFIKWGDHWDSIEDVVQAVRQHKRNVTIKVGYSWDDSNYLEDV